MPNTYRALSVNSEKGCRAKKHSFFVWRPTDATLRLNFSWQLGPMGRPAKHLYGLGRVSQSLVLRPNLNLLSRDAIQRRVPVQKLYSVNPAAVHSSRRRFSRASRDSSFLRTCGWGGVAQLFFHSFSRVGDGSELKRAGPIASHLARGPAVGKRAVWPLAGVPIKSAESVRAQRRPAVLWHQ